MFYIKIPYLDLEECYSLEQGKSWYRIKEGKYCITKGDKFITVEQGYKGNFGFSCSEDDFYKYWYDYFAVDYDYLQASYKIWLLDDEFKRVAVRGRGIRILREQFNEVLIREVFREKFKNISMQPVIYTEWVKSCIGKKHKNSTRGSGDYTWYDMPDDVDYILKNFEKVVKFFKKETPKANRKDVIWCLKMIKEIFTDINNGWHNFEQMKDANYESWEVIDVLMSYDISYETAQRIALYGTHKLDIFIVDKEIEKCIFENMKDMEYEDVDEFIACNLSNPSVQRRAAYMNMLMRYDVINPPKPGDELLWV